MDLDKENKLVLIKKLDRQNKWGSFYGLYQCSCGKQKEIVISKVKSDQTISCGCSYKKHLDKMHNQNKTHGISNSSEYTAWRHMKARCYNTNNSQYKDYGGRGIKVCDRWLNSFENFYEDMGPKPSKDLTLERKDNNSNYFPENCIWDTRKQQGKNRRTNIWITYNGKTQILYHWSHEYGISYQTIKHRLDKGWSIEDALLTPTRNK